MFGRSDTLNGVTENIMCGQLSKIGTGMVDLLLDDVKLQVRVGLRLRVGWLTYSWTM